LLGEGAGETGLPGDRKETPLQFRVSEGERGAVEELSQDAYAWAPPHLIETVTDLLRRCELEPVGLVDRALQTPKRKPRRDVDQRAGGAGYGDAPMLS